MQVRTTRKLCLSLQCAVVMLWLVAEEPAFAQFVSSSENGISNEGAAPKEPVDESMQLDMRLTLSSFVYAEVGEDGDPLLDGGEPLQTASPSRRVFGDLRLEFGAKRKSGEGVTLEFDGRARETNRGDVQSGFRGGEEWDLRDAYLRYGLGKRAVTLGRHRIGAADASTIDGLSYHHQNTKVWSTVLFAGLSPTRGSRSLAQDYPRGAVRYDEDGMTTEIGRRIIPAIAGAGASYAKPSVHGDIGVGGIIPFRRDGVEGSRARPQVFLHSNGYWNTSESTTFYHYATADLASAQGAALRNLSAALRSQAATHLVLRASVHHLSNDQLRQSVVNQLEEPDTTSMGLVQNGLTLSRVASQTVRAAASVDAARRRLQFTLGASARQRPNLELVLADGSTFQFPTSRRAELSMHILDRRSVLGLRLAAEFRLQQGLGKQDLATSKGGVAYLEASRELLDGWATLQLDAAVQSLEDADRRGTCEADDPLTCFGQSKVQAAQAGLQLTVQSSKRWMFLVDGHWGVEKVETHDANQQPLELPLVHSLTVFARLRYRYR